MKINKLRFLFMLIVASGLSACYMPYSDPSTLPDYQNQADSAYFSAFQVGDWFELRKPMFLINSTSSGKLITRPGHDAPLVEDFLAAGGKLPYPNYDIIRYLPKGTRIKVVAVKKPSNFGPIAYFYLDSEHPWVDALVRENWCLYSEYDLNRVEKLYGNKNFGKNVQFVVDYDREYIKKVN